MNTTDRLERDINYNEVDQVVGNFVETNNAADVVDYLAKNPQSVHEFSQLVGERWGTENMSAALIRLGDVMEELIKRNQELLEKKS